MRRLTFGVALMLLITACGDDATTETSDPSAISAATNATADDEIGGDFPSECRPPPGPQLAYDPSGPNEFDVICDLVYKAAPSGIDQTLAAYIPTGTPTGELLPTVIFFHTNGSPDEITREDRERPISADWKTGLDTHAQVVASLGMVGITFNYSQYPLVSDGGQVPREEAVGFAAQDAADLLTYLAEHGEELNVDPNRMCVWTAGTGSLVGAYATLTGDPEPQCAVVFTGFLDRPFAGQYSPVGVVSADMPPFFIARGGTDFVSNDGIDRFVSATREAGGEITLERVPGGFSFEMTDLPDTPAAIEKALDFVMQHLGIGAQ